MPGSTGANALQKVANKHLSTHPQGAGEVEDGLSLGPTSLIGDGGTGTSPGGGPPKGPVITIAGVSITLDPTPTTYLRIEQVLGDDWTREAREAARQGPPAVMALLAPHLPVVAQALPSVKALVNGYSGWAAKQPPLLSGGEPLGTSAPKSVTLDAGEFGGMVALQQGVGVMLGGLVTMPGRSVEVKVSAAASVEGVFLSTEMSLSVSRDDHGLSIKGQARIGVGVGSADDAASLRETIGVAGSGDDGIEAMNMVGLGLEHWLRTQQFDWSAPSWDEAVRVGKRFAANLATLTGPAGPMAAPGAMVLALLGAKIADVLWGKGFEDAVVEGMDGDDYGSFSVGGGLEARVDDKEVERRGSIDYGHTDKFTNVNGAIGTTTEDKLTASAKLGIKAGAFDLEFGGKIELPLTMDDMTMSFEIGVKKTNPAFSGPASLGPSVVNLFHGAAAGVAQRAGGFVEEVADALETFFGFKEVATVFAGVGEAKVEVSYNHEKGQLSVTLSVVQSLEQKFGDANANVKLSFQTGDEVLKRDFDVGRP